MESFSQVIPWIAVGVLFAVVVFFSTFYIIRLLKANPGTTSADHSGQRTISADEKTKLKNEIVHDIVADITPVLEKRLEKAF